jgi:hypothetical protein
MKFLAGKLVVSLIHTMNKKNSYIQIQSTIGTEITYLDVRVGHMYGQNEIEWETQVYRESKAEPYALPYMIVGTILRRINVIFFNLFWRVNTRDIYYNDEIKEEMLQYRVYDWVARYYLYKVGIHQVVFFAASFHSQWWVWTQQPVSIPVAFILQPVAVVAPQHLGES